MNASAKRITAAICLALSLGALAPITANADPLAAKMGTRANTGDIGYILKFSNGGKDSTEDAQKQDASSTYIRAARKDMASCRLYVEAKTGINPPLHVGDGIRLRAPSSWGSWNRTPCT